ncbi:uncharacterized protein LOC122515321 [Polistes fuscatus]|uniref:uncharacterized protein LOC122515321 n=1 Tax=Polistes fuscatus TaxID=30207 RepID=UPI001CAA1F7B|nr:uncharacterized protein LOC122515321 [Polistes fuscatus]
MRQKDIVRCMAYIDEDLNDVTNKYHRDIILERVRYGKRFFTVICVFLHSTVLYMRLILPLIKGNIKTAENVTVRPLPSAGYYFHLFDDQVSPFYEMVFFLQCAQGCVTIYTNITICTLAVIFVVHACSQLEIFINLLEDIVTHVDSKENDQRKYQNCGKFYGCVTIYTNITICTLAVIFVVHACSQLEIFINLLEDIVTHVDSKENINVDKKLSIAVKHHIRVRKYDPFFDWGKQDVNTVISIIIAILSVTVQIFVFCLVGEQLMLQDEKVAVKSCILEWNRIPYKKAKNIIPIVMLSNRRTKITAGTIIELSLQTFGQVSTLINISNNIHQFFDCHSNDRQLEKSCVSYFSKLKIQTRKRNLQLAQTNHHQSHTVLTFNNICKIFANSESQRKT